MIKYILLGLMLIISPAVFAAEEIVLLKPNQAYIYPFPVLTAYSLKDYGVNVEVVGSQAKVTSTGQYGKFSVQFLNQDNSVTTKIFENKLTKSEPSNFYNYGTGDYGYFLNMRAYFSDVYGGNASLLNRYGANVYLSTRLSDFGKLTASFDMMENSPSYYYFRLGIGPSFYVSYGDRAVSLPFFKSAFLTQPRLRQYGVGFNGDKLMLDLWSGKLSPFPPSFTPVSPVNRPGLESGYYSLDNQFYGVNSRWSFGPSNQNSVFFSSWYNQDKKSFVPYMGFSLRDKSGINRISTTLGNSAESPVYGLQYEYNNYGAKKWTIRQATLRYDLAKDGYEDLIFSNVLASENLNLRANFYGPGINDKRGSITFEPSYLYLLNGFNQSSNLRGSAGWKNNRFGASLFGAQVLESYLSVSQYNQYTLGPQFSYTSDRKIDLPFQTNAAYYKDIRRSNISTLGGYERDTFRLGGSVRFGNLVPRLDLAQIYTHRNDVDYSSFVVAPSLRYNIRNLKLEASAYLNFNSTEQLVSNTSLRSNVRDGLTNQRYALSSEYGFWKYHSLNLRLARYQDYLSSGYNSVYLGYNFRIGDQKKSILSILDSRKVTGQVFEDLNFNGKKDENEPGIKDVGITASTESQTKDINSDTSDSDGRFSLGGFEEKFYSLELDTRQALGENFIVISSVAGVDFRQQSKFEVNVPVMEVKRYRVRVEDAGDSENAVFLKLDCEKKGISVVSALPGQEISLVVPAKDTCRTYVDLDALSGGSTSGEISLQNPDQEYVIGLDTRRNLIGQIFIDKNQDNQYQFGEELKGAKVIFQEFTLTSNETGVWSKTLDENTSAVNFIKVEGGKQCRALFDKKITQISQKKVYLIRCQP